MLERNEAITNTELNTLFDARGEVDCDSASWDNSSNGNNFDEVISWKQMQKNSAKAAMERRAYLDVQKQQQLEEGGLL